jgi:ACDE family multidrug resistance protein
VLVAAVSFALTIPPLPIRRAPGSEHATLRSLLDRRIALVAVKGMAGYLGFTGIGFVVALVVAREFDLGPGATGLVVATYGIGGMIFGRYGGSVTDRAGRPRTAFLGTLACTAGVLALAFVPSLWWLVLAYFVVGCAAAFAWAALNTIVVESFTRNRAGAVSAYGAFKFVGVALAPLVYVPLFNADTRAPFLLAAGFSALCALLVLPWYSRYRGGASGT